MITKARLIPLALTSRCRYLVSTDEPLDYSWDEDSERDYLAWVPSASVSEKKVSIELMTVFIQGIVADRAQGLPEHEDDLRGAYSADNRDIDLYRIGRGANMCLCAGIHWPTNSCRLVIIGQCSLAHQWALAIHRLKNWRVY